MAEKTLLIINPIAGGGSNTKKLYLLEQEISQRPGYLIRKTTHRGHAAELASNLTKQFNKVIAVGGDGTVNEVASALAGSDKVMGIIPFGSGNGLAHHLKIPGKWQKALAVAENGTPKPIDVIEVNNRMVINVGGLGFDGHVANIFNKTARRGKLGYMRIILQELRQYREFPFTIKAPGQTIIGEAFIMAIANSTEFGNRFKIAPQARHDDGLFNLIVVKKPPFLKLLYLMLQGFRGKLKPSQYFQDYPLAKAKITFSNTLVHVDGEIDEAGLASPLHLKIHRHALRVLC